jgi:hypothetical protein
VLSYLSRYTHRVAIDSGRILCLEREQGTVTFTYKDYKDPARRKTMTLSLPEFLRRFCLHILPERIAGQSLPQAEDRTRPPAARQRFAGPRGRHRGPTRGPCGSDPGPGHLPAAALPAVRLGRHGPHPAAPTPVRRATRFLMKPLRLKASPRGGEPSSGFAPPPCAPAPFRWPVTTCPAPFGPASAARASIPKGRKPLPATAQRG